MIVIFTLARGLLLIAGVNAEHETAKEAANAAWYEYECEHYVPFVN